MIIWFLIALVASQQCTIRTSLDGYKQLDPKCSFCFQVKLVLPIYYIVLYSSRLPAFHQDQLQTVAVSELPGYPGRRHAQRSHYITTKFPHKEISTIDQNFTWAMPGYAWVWNRQWCPQTYVCTYHSFFSTTNCAPIPSLLISNQLRQPTASMAHCPLPD